MQVNDVQPGVVYEQAPMPKAGISGGTFKVLAVGIPYESPNGTHSSTYRRLKVQNVDTGAVSSNPFLNDAELNTL